MRKLANRAAVVLLLQTTLFGVQLNVMQPAIAHSDAEIPISEELIGGKPFCVSHQVINARPEQVWQVLSDYSNASRVFPMMKKCQVLEDHGNNKIVKHCVAPSGPVGTFEYTLALKETAPRALEWHRISGDFKEVDGFWKLEPLDNGHSTLVTYSSHVNGGMFMPQMLIKRQCKLDMPIIMASLKRQAENGAQIAVRPATTHAQ